MAVFLAVVSSVACHKLTSPSGNLPQTFTGLLQVGGVFQEHFTIPCGGSRCEYGAMIKTMVPDLAFVSLGISTYGQGACQVLIQSTITAVGQSGLVNLVPGGEYCIIVADAGYIQRPQTFTVTVNFP